MAIAKLGTIHKLVYASKNFKSGLTNISIKVLKPDGSVHASGTMTEFSEAGFEGVYYFNVSTLINDPQGEYAAMITEPTANHKAKAKVSYVTDLGGSGGVSEGGTDTIELELDIKKESLEFAIESSELKLGLETRTIGLNIVTEGLNLDISHGKLDMNIEQKGLELELECNH
jgi:hypothetical protein